MARTLIFLLLALAACAAAPTGGAVRMEKGATAERVDTGAAADPRSVKFKEVTGGRVNVSATYSALDRRTTGLIGFMIAGVAAFGLLGWACPLPPGRYTRMIILLAMSAAAAVAVVLLIGVTRR